MTADDDIRDIIFPDQAIAVRETRTLFRLTPSPEQRGGPLGRQIAIVAADTEEEARRLAAQHDRFGGDWLDSAFAAADAQQTEEDHVFGDVVFRSEPVSSPVRKRAGARKA